MPATSLVRVCMLVVVVATTAPMIAVSLLALGIPRLIAFPATLVPLAALVAFLYRRIPATLADRSKPQVMLFAFWVAISLFAAYRLGGLAVFMHDVERTEYAFNPTLRPLNNPQLAKPFFVKHNCFTCYIIAAHLASEGEENIYLRTLYRKAEEPTAIHQEIGDKVTIDTYQYPPAFLILPKLMMKLGLGFFQMRTCWFAMIVILFCVCTATLARRFGGKTFNGLWFAWPAVLAAPNTLGSLQIGNVHFLIIIICVLALVAFESRRVVLGGALLGFAIAAKVFPGLLLVFLLAQRRWREAIWTGVAIVVCCASALLVFGLQPFRAFVDYQLPRLASGEAFDFATKHIGALTGNLSVVGIAHKLGRLDFYVFADPAVLAKIITWGYSIGLLVVLFLLRRRRGQASLAESSYDGGLLFAKVWIAILILAQLRSPFLPWTYGTAAVLWFVGMLAPSAIRRAWTIVPVTLLWAVFAFNVPFSIGPRSGAFDLICTLIALLILLVMIGVVVFRGYRAQSVVSPQSSGEFAHSDAVGVDATDATTF